MSNDNEGIEVTDHAVVRYLERVKGINIDRIRQKIGTRDVTVLAKAMGKGDYPVRNKFYARVHNDKVVTIIPIKSNQSNE